MAKKVAKKPSAKNAEASEANSNPASEALSRPDSAMFEISDAQALMCNSTDPVAAIRDVYTQVHIEIEKLFKSESEDALQRAAGWWDQVPVWIDSFVGRESKRLEGNVKAVYWLKELGELLLILNEAVVSELMSHAEKHGIDSAQIFISGYHCREMVKQRGGFSNGVYDRWPECLGSQLYDLPADVRRSILEGHAAVSRLKVIRGIKPPDKFTIWLDTAKMITLLKSHDIALSDQTVCRKKQMWNAEPQPGSNNQRFRFKLSDLHRHGINVPTEWLT